MPTHVEEIVYYVAEGSFPGGLCMCASDRAGWVRMREKLALPHLWPVLLFSTDAPLKITQSLEMYSFPSTGFMGGKAQTFCVEIQIFRDLMDYRRL